jgi:hypothetical protein
MTVNVAHSLSADGHWEVDLNFHWDAPSATKAKELLSGTTQKSLQIARKLMSDVYQCPMEESDD